MELIEVSIGLRYYMNMLIKYNRKNKDKKMEVLKERSGKCHQGILEIGMIIAKKDSGYNSIRRETSMKGCGKEINDMGRERIGGMSQEEVEGVS